MNREAAERVKKYIDETRKMIGNDQEVLNMANGHKLLASDLLLLAGLASQAQPPEYTFDQLTKLLMQAATKEGHKVTMKIKWAQTPAPEGEKE